MRLFVNVYYPEWINAVYQTRAYADGAYPHSQKQEAIEVEYPGTLEEAKYELAKFSRADLLRRYPLPDTQPGAATAGTVAAQSIPYTLPVNSEERKNVPILGGCVRYFPAALAGVGRHSKAGNDKHNKGESMHHARWKSMDHEECIQRHLIDLQDVRAFLERHPGAVGGAVPALLSEANALCWRALALSQELHEKYAGAPLAPSARVQS